jgi:Bacterial PH domain
LKVRGRLRGVWLALWLAGAAGCVAVGLYGDTPEDTLGSHQIFLSLFLLLAAVSVVLAVRSFGRGLDADGNGVVVRNMFRARSIPWRDLAAIEFKGDSEVSEVWEDSEVWDISGWFCKLVFQRRDGSRVTADAPGGGIRPGEYLFELRERLLAMRSAAGEDQEGDWEDSWPAYPAESHVQGAATDQPKGRFRTVGDWLAVAFVVVWVVLFGLPAFLIVVLDALPLVGDWLTAHVPFWDEVTDFYDWLWSYAS